MREAAIKNICEDDFLRLSYRSSPGTEFLLFESTSEVVNWHLWERYIVVVDRIGKWNDIDNVLRFVSDCCS